MEHKSTTPAAQPVQPAPYAAGTGSAPLLNREAEFACMSYRERLALNDTVQQKRLPHDTYRRLREK